jgi:acetyl/propionyl-CoA carboxylase alpha subunit
MIGKVITWAPSREENIARMKATLKELVIFGVPTNIEFLKAVLENSHFRDNSLSTRFLEEEFPRGYTPLPLTKSQRDFATKAQQSPLNTGASVNGGALNYTSPWTSL